MQRYNPKDIETKWQKIWADQKIYEVSEKSDKTKKYITAMFPYPSGAGLHVGHVRNYSITDAIARYNRQKGHNVLTTIGWDAFGLPAENYAIKTGVSPQKSTSENIVSFKNQLLKLGMSYDWSREVNTTDPSYYKWTQWIFTKLFEKGLAYQKESLQWWCETDKTVLANEQVENGKCWRCGNEVVKKSMTQWFFKITEYADELLEGIDDLEWPEKIKTMQKNWIGKSEGMLFTAPVKDTNINIQTFSAHFEAFRADTFVVIAPDHPFLDELIKGVGNAKEIKKFANDIIKKRADEGFADQDSIEGIFTGRYIIDPVGNGELPIWVASYALADYGTGIVKCSAHDERDFRFAKKYDIPLKTVLYPVDSKEAKLVRDQEVCYTDMQNGVLTEPDKFAGAVAGRHRQDIIDYLVEQNLAEQKTSYRMHDWLISRQRYWGAPIPVIHCPKDGAVPVPEKDLPVVLPEVKDYQTDDKGRTALEREDNWVNVDCPKCGGKAKRETDTMDGYACSSWYFLRYTDANNDEKAWDPDKANYWLPIDYYCGGDHAVSHLLYSRFWMHFFADEGMIAKARKEPVHKLVYNGYINASDGTKMSKSKGNVVDPLEIIDQGYGADALRVYELFIAPYELDAAWDPGGIAGTYRFLNRSWVLVQEFLESDDEPNDNLDVKKSSHKAIKKVTDDLERLNFNTAIAGLMEYVNELYKLKAKSINHSKDWRDALCVLAQLMAPFAPHIAEELWQQLGNKESVHSSKWPEHDPKYLVSDSVKIVVQVNGRLRATIELPKDSAQEYVEELAKKQENVEKYLSGQKIKKVIFVANRLMNFVV